MLSQGLGSANSVCSSMQAVTRGGLQYLSIISVELIVVEDGDKYVIFISQH